MVTSDETRTYGICVGLERSVAASSPGHGAQVFAFSPPHFRYVGLLGFEVALLTAPTVRLITERNTGIEKVSQAER